ncbi:hypothetical protein CAEBREN_11724 [Caenorhabditis brenneri]|uniref:Uncharacterized protein n=1 Tax=Caenorhabditis brenneri TaxID=135651 RepID=G0N1S9_CAEBE|nr:hypothetical protein CAEBREN_11724 [Caenorhabditis brenneri]
MWATINVKVYEKQGKRLGVVLAAHAVAISAISIFIVIENEDGQELINTCLTFSASKSIGNRIYSMFLGQLILNGVISVMHFVLYKYNKKKKRRNSTSLSEQFQHNENVKTMKQVTPLLFLSNVTIGIYIFVISVVRLYQTYLPPNWYEIIAAILFIMPHMPLMISSRLLYELHRDKKRIVENHERIMANQDIPLSDQFNIPIGNWDTHFEELNGPIVTASQRENTRSLFSKLFCKRRQTRVEVSTIF